MSPELQTVSQEDTRLVNKVVQGLSDSSRKFFDALSDHERRHALKMIKDIRMTGVSRDYDLLWELDYEKRPPTVKEFLDEEYYMGKVGKLIYPKWKEDIEEILSPSQDYVEVIFDGAIGTGKTLIGSILMSYMVANLLLLRSPQEYYGLPENDEIVFGIFNVNLNLAWGVNYKRLKGYFDTSEFFLDQYDPNRRKGGWAEAYIKLRKKVGFAVGSGSIHALGCFIGQTEVTMLDGTERTFKELCDLYSDDEYFDVYSLDEEDHVTVGVAHHPHKTGTQVPVYKVTLDNGKSEICTPDHLWKLRDGSYRKAIDLKLDDDLSSRRDQIKFGSIEFYGYEDVYDITVDDYHNFALSSGVFVHNSHVFGGLVDEVNFQKYSAGSQMLDIYLAIRERMFSRFMDEETGLLPGKLILASSKKFSNSELEKHIESVKDDPLVFYRRYATWEVKPKLIDESKRFYMVVGNVNFQTKTYDDEVEVPEGAKKECMILDVPWQFRRRADLNPEQFLVDVAGVVAFSGSKLFPNMLVIKEVFDKSRRKHPFTKLELSDISTNTDVQVHEYLIKDMLFKESNNVSRLIDYPSIPRNISVDLGVIGDSTGISMGCAPERVIRAFTDEDGVEYEDWAYLIFMDFNLRINPPVTGEIDISKIRAFIMYLKKLGVRIGLITYDGWQSRNEIQFYNKVGISAKVLSIDRTDEPYLSYRNAVIEDRLRMYYYEPLYIESANLIHDTDKRKVDHPKYNVDGTKGSKDCADPTAGVIYNCVTGKDYTRGRVAEQLKVTKSATAIDEKSESIKTRDEHKSSLEDWTLRDANMSRRRV